MGILLNKATPHVVFYQWGSEKTAMGGSLFWTHLIL
jgi:hypothetical protein